MRHVFVLLALGLWVSTAFGADDYLLFLKEAQSLFENGDYNASRDLCEAVLDRNPKDSDATQILKKNHMQLKSLSREAYEHGVLLESFNELDAAQQYWHRASNYLRPCDHYYEWVHERLAHYQVQLTPTLPLSFFGAAN